MFFLFLVFILFVVLVMLVMFAVFLMLIFFVGLILVQVGFDQRPVVIHPLLVRSQVVNGKGTDTRGDRNDERNDADNNFFIIVTSFF